MPGDRPFLGCQVDVVLLGDGVLEADFQQAATVHSLPCRGGTNAGLELARKLRAGGADVAIANTTVSGLFASDLSAAGFRLVSLVHELPGVIESYGLHAHAQRIARDADLWCSRPRRCGKDSSSSQRSTRHAR